MQTFLPFKDFRKSAQALDSKRLNKQVLECYQILKVLSSTDPKAGWRNHPAVKMWRNHEVALLGYTMAMIREAHDRGIKTDKNLANLTVLVENEKYKWGTTDPDWYNDDIIMKRVTATHKANLYRKDPVYYVDFGAAVHTKDNKPCCDRCNYYWVTHVEAA